ncbi:MAG: hypothetical protein LBM28_00535 [Oscillospiraceae bacterium]|jgi:rubrerythrin|nr:hypothetical protein [Oscillospiraceae bacterium]
MNPYDPVAVQAVWNRVHNTEPTTLELPLEEALQSFIDDERVNSSTYIALARKAGRHASALRAMAVEESGHARRLAALYYLLTGREYLTRAREMKMRRSFREELRLRYNEKLRSGQSYRQAAERWQEQEPLFHSLARDEQRHAEIFHGIMQNLLQR